MSYLTAYQTVADQDGFGVVFPDGVGSTWNVGLGVCGMGHGWAGSAAAYGGGTQYEDATRLTCPQCPEGGSKQAS